MDKVSKPWTYEQIKAHALEHAPEEEYACYECADEKTCPFAWDTYNIGETLFCLAVK